MTTESRLNGSETLPIEVTLASPEDAEAIVRIQASVWLATYPNETYGITYEDIQGMGLDNSEAVRSWKLQIERKPMGQKTFVAKEGGRIVGYCFCRRREGESYIQAIYVDLGQQGKGIGRALMGQALAWLGSEKPVSLGVAIYNTDAIAFYKKLGFEKSDEAPESPPPLPSGKVLPIVKMVRPAGYDGCDPS